MFVICDDVIHLHMCVVLAQTWFLFTTQCAIISERYCKLFPFKGNTSDWLSCFILFHSWNAIKHQCEIPNVKKYTQYFKPERKFIQVQISCIPVNDPHRIDTQTCCNPQQCKYYKQCITHFLIVCILCHFGCL